jgi:hypothetical protein
MNTVSVVIGIVIGIASNYIFRIVTYFFGKPKLEICNYLIKSVNKNNVPSLQFKLINHSYFSAIDIELTLHAVKYRNDDRSLKDITFLSKYKIDFLQGKPFGKNKYFHNAFRGNFIHLTHNIHELVDDEKIDEVEIFLKAYNSFNNSLTISYNVILKENIKDFSYEFNIGDKCQSPSEISNKTLPQCDLSKKELLNNCPFLNS